ncbi:MAG: tryptophan--tRNA ligase [Ruminococcus sp.]|nr:tryptophan--tRNA ligase [Ruminococcus sp.]MBR2305354.1 tryptophan--tRNA ligase [Ruminococcus sp.]
MAKEIILTGDRPTGALHLGHYVGSLRKRVELQNTGKYDTFVMIADLQALTDNADNPEKIRQNILNVMLDYLAVGLTPEKTTFLVQSHIPALYELPMYYSNLVTMSRLERNPTIKNEIKMRDFERSIPVGFMTYPISQAADITAFKAKYVPVGEDQLPMLEQAREIVNSFNRIYNCDILVEPQAVLPDNASCNRLVGTDGNTKMSKSLGNCIYLKDDEKTLKTKIMSMFTDPTHINVSDPGHTEGNPVFIYLEAFSKEEDFAEFLPEYKNLDEMKEHYEKGGLGDMKCKKFLNSVMQQFLAPIRTRREEFEKDKGELLNILRKGTEHAIEVSNETVAEVRNAIGINYFNDKSFLERFVK